MEGKKRVILLVEDDPGVNELIQTFLSRYNYEVMTAWDAPEGIELAIKHLPDIALIDLALPTMHGFELADKLKAMPLTSDIPVIFVTSTSDTETIIQGLQKYAVDFIVKPFELRELLVRIEVALRNKTLKNIEKRKILKAKPIFISYSRANWDKFVYPLVNQFETEGLPFWVDQHQIEGSNDWLDEINKALKICSCVLVCVTPESLQSRYVKMEYRYAFNNGKKLYPLVCRPSKLPAELQLIQHYPYNQLDTLIRLLKGELNNKKG